jgi:DNA-binding beta-propeller fold protein YncE
VVQGVEVEFSIAPLGGDTSQPGKLMEEQDALVRFRVTDAATRTPLAGARPSAWITQREGAADLKVCREKIQSFLQGTLRSRPDVDLNTYYVLALNQEPNISVIDPLLSFGGSKLVTLVPLSSPGEDWVITKDSARLFVSMPTVNQVAVVDTNTWRVVDNIKTSAKPLRLLLAPDEKSLLVATDEGAESGVTIVDTATLKVMGKIATGAGHHEIALSDDNKFAYVTNRNAGVLTFIDMQKLTKVGDVKVGATAVGFSPLSKAAYVSDEDAGTIAVVDGRTQRVQTDIAVQPGVGRVRFAPGGRYGFAPNPRSGVVYIFDAASNRLLHTVPVGKGPDQIAFTKEFAYVRLAGAVEVSMIRLSTVGKQLNVVTFPGGQSASAESRTPLGIADAIVPGPEGNSVFVANAADQQLYYYTEGMAAPMGSFQNYRRDPRAVLVADRSLREARTGVYETVTRIPAAGTYDVAFLLDAPRVTHCFEAQAVENPVVQHKPQVPLRVEYLDHGKRLNVGSDYKLRFRLFDTTTKKPKDGLTDVHVLAFLAPGLWQKRSFAKGAGDGIYELTINVPQSGVYLFFIASNSQKVSFRELPYLTLQAAQSATSGTAPAKGQQP